MSHYTHARSTAPSAPKRCVVYCRVSSTGQEDNSSLQTQEADCRAYAEQHGWTVAQVYREVHTGRDLFERPQLTLLREAMRRREFDVLLVWALDRLSRKQTHQGLILSEAEYAGVEWDSATEDIDNSPQGQILRAVIGGMAEMERAKIVERTRRGIRSRAESGKLLPGCRPLYGYAWSGEDKSSFQLNPVTSQIVQRIYSEFLSGKTLRAISRGLADDGVPTPTGKLSLWGIKTISDILKNPAYTGTGAAFRYETARRQGSGPRVSIRALEDQIALPEGTIPQIVSWAEHEAAVARLDHNRATSNRNNKNPEATLLRAGFIRCGYCGCAMTVNHSSTQRNRPTVYRCGPVSRDQYGCPACTIKAADLDNAVWARVREVLLNPDIIAGEARRRKAVSNTSHDLELIDRQLAAIDRQRQNLLRAIGLLEDDQDSLTLLTQEMTRLTKQRSELVDDRKMKASQQAAELADTDRLLDLADWCRRTAENLELLNYEERRMVLDALGVRVRVWKTDHQPRWELEMAPLPIATESPIVYRTARGSPARRCWSRRCTAVATPRPRIRRRWSPTWTCRGPA